VQKFLYVQKHNLRFCCKNDLNYLQLSISCVCMLTMTVLCNTMAIHLSVVFVVFSFKFYIIIKPSWAGSCMVYLYFTEHVINWYMLFNPPRKCTSFYQVTNEEQASGNAFL